MLVLSRKKEESIIIGNNIEIKILKISGNTVEIGINAPSNLSIYREEVYKEIQNTTLKATKSISSDDLEKLKKIFK